MKKIFTMFTIAICGLISCSPSGEKMSIPENVKTKFAALYPNAANTQWEMEDGNYEASFKKDDAEISVVLSAEGTVVQTETEIDVMQLPQSVKDYVASQLGGKPISSAAKIVDSSGRISYEAEVEKTDFLFDETGQFAGKEDEEKGEDDDR